FAREANKMDFWDILSYSAWIISAGLLLWMLMDAIRINREYDEDLLISSREGADELLEADEKEGRS
ncbi:MAG: hypothetical protein OEY16_06955, partial [Alphaproteobacteria bacterium]|nr:hypothetical protein [Alphaproteobacteria bacterium]